VSVQDESPAAPETREELEAERDFLLRSLDDLEAELLAGNIDPDNYRELHDDYTARASAVISSLEDGVDRSQRTEPRFGTTMRVLSITGVIVFCLLVAYLVARSSGQRHPGQTITGNSNVTVDPNSYEGHMAAANSAYRSGDIAGAIKEYTAAARIDPTQAEPLATRGFITAQASSAATNPADAATLLRQALADVDNAIRINPAYTNAYALKGAILLNVAKKPAEAIPVLEEFLRRAPPDDPLRGNVLTLLAQARGNPATSPTTHP